MQVEPYESTSYIQGAVNMVLRLRWDESPASQRRVSQTNAVRLDSWRRHVVFNMQATNRRNDFYLPQRVLPWVPFISFCLTGGVTGRGSVLPHWLSGRAPQSALLLLHYSIAVRDNIVMMKWRLGTRPPYDHDSSWKLTALLLLWRYIISKWRRIVAFSRTQQRGRSKVGRQMAAHIWAAEAQRAGCTVHSWLNRLLKVRPWAERPFNMTVVWIQQQTGWWTAELDMEINGFHAWGHFCYTSVSPFEVKLFLRKFLLIVNDNCLIP